MELVNSLEGRLLFAVPKKGRLQPPTLNLLEGADIQFRRENRLDIALVKNLPVALLFLPAADIPTFVGEGRVDLGITGLDQVQEHDARVRSNAPAAQKPEGGGGSDAGATATRRHGGCETVMSLGFGGCKLQVQVPQSSTYHESRDLIGKTIGTSFVSLAKDYFAKLEAEEKSKAENGVGAEVKEPNGIGLGKLRTEIIELSGSVEAACAMGVADGIVDLVESGETMRAAGLKAIDTVVDSEAILIRSRAPSNPDVVELIRSRIEGVITAQRYVLCQYNIPRSRLTEARLITPGKRAPTITSLEEEGWVAVSVMVTKKDIAVVMDKLTTVGATDVLVLNIQNTRGT